jgi:histidine triad (HIT) family protein
MSYFGPHLRTPLNAAGKEPGETAECIFCRIIARRQPAEILFENDRVVAILDINPIHHGHALVIPKTHSSDFLTVPVEELAELTRAAQIVARAMVSGLHLEGFNVFSNNGRVAGQSVFHFHLHITPRYAHDNIRFVLTLKSYRDGEMQEYANTIRHNMAGHQH